MKISFYTLTGIGKRHAGRVGMRYRDSILDYLYKIKRANVEDISMETGMSEGDIKSRLRTFVASRMVEEVNV